jgi:hypothetical protein
MSWRLEAARRAGRLEAFREVQEVAAAVGVMQTLPGVALRRELERLTTETVAQLSVPDSGPATSQEAARELKVRAGSLRARVLRQYAVGDWTDEEVGNRIGHPRIWPRCSELRSMGCIRGTSETRECPRTGASVEVCSLTPEGRTVLDSMPRDQE